MGLALSLAANGRGKVDPNPMVGCVIVNNGSVVGTGYHEYFGGPHAEVNALSNAGARAYGATLYVTLEPCNHWGKTPPCTDAILSAGIRRVVAAMADPNPRITGKGLKRLRENGITITVGIRQREACRLNREYVHRFLSRRAPRVTVKAAMSLDGKIATRNGESKWITGQKARDYVHRLRSTYDAIMVGINTVIRDNPALTSHGMGNNPVRVIIDPRLRTPLRSRILDGEAPTIILHAEGVPASRARGLRDRQALLVPMKTSKGRISFAAIVKRLNGFDLYRILIEGGGETIAEALESNIVNDVLFFVAPKIIGGREAITAVEGNGIPWMDTVRKVRHMKTVRIGSDLLISGDVEKPCLPAL